MLPHLLLALVPFPQATPTALDIAPSPGRWRAWLDCPGGELPFEFVLERGEDSWTAQLVNGAERVAIGAVRVDAASVVLRFDPYDSEVRATLIDDGAAMRGEWVRYRAPGRETRMAFQAERTDAPRFEVRELVELGAAFSVDGRWRVQFSEDEHHAVGAFVGAGGTRVHGTFLTTLGDYRFLAGAFDGRTLSLSCFDGAHAFLFRATKQADGTLAGDFWSRDAWHETWTAVRDDGVEMPDPFGLTRWVGGVPLAELAFPDTNGVARSLADEAFAGKARLVVLFGTWCPNCNDLTDYLVELDRRYGPRGLSVLGLAFEFGDDFDRNARVVEAYAAHHGARFPMLVAGTSDKAAASKAFPVLDRVRAYPTTLFMTAEGDVEAVHTGFSGPATGAAHERVRQAFERRIEALLTASGEGR